MTGLYALVPIVVAWLACVGRVRYVEFRRPKGGKQ